MDIKVTIETISEQQNWKEFLMTQPKDQIVELMINKMVRDTNFSREIYHKLSK